MVNSEVGSSGRNPHGSGVCVHACMRTCVRAYEWGSVTECSVPIYDLLSCDKLHTFPPSRGVNIVGRGEQEGHLEVIHMTTQCGDQGGYTP